MSNAVKDSKFKWVIMKRKLTPKEILFNIDLDDDEKDIELKDIPQILTAYKDIRNAVNIEEENYNVYLVDSFSKESINTVVKYIEEIYINKEKPQDICYVTYEDVKKPKVLFLGNGRGKNFCRDLEEIKNKYFDICSEFNNSSSEQEKDIIIESISSKRSSYINELINLSKKEGFDVKASNSGFAFIPLNDGEAMTEKEYDELEDDKKDEIIYKASELKVKAEIVLEKIKKIEETSMVRLKDIYRDYINEKFEEDKHALLIEYILDNDAYDYLEKIFTQIEKKLVENYSISPENDVDAINKILDLYNASVLVDNSEYKNPRVIYEENSTVVNLLGNIEFENQNGSYDTDISLIYPGSILLANEGCIIIRLNELISNNYSYFALKKILLSGKVNIDCSKNYFELLSLNSIKPEPIPVNVKVILIGDYESYEILYNSDEDFKKLFPIIIEMDKSIKMDNIKRKGIKKFIENRAIKYGINNLSKEVIREIAKYLCRLTENKEKILMDIEEIDKILVLARNKVAMEGKKEIDKEDIFQIIYTEKNIQNEINEMYKDNKIKVSLEGKKIGVINGLAVIDFGFLKFGKSIRVTCIAYRGSGRIIDIQKESNLSGSIHEKSINILSGILANFINPYEQLPVDFHLCFEQTYGIIDGDSASVAEIISMISALTKIPIKQNIAVTGSLNQLGEVQVIGGINEKIEGFYKIGKYMGVSKGLGVIIPNSNVNELILSNEVEESITKGEFHIYTMENLEDALEIMLDCNINEINKKVKLEIEKYKFAIK